MHIENDIYFNMFSCLLEHKMSNYRKSARGQPNFHYQLPYTVSDSHGITITKLTALSHCAAMTNHSKFNTISSHCTAMTKHSKFILCSVTGCKFTVLSHGCPPPQAE